MDNVDTFAAIVDYLDREDTLAICSVNKQFRNYMRQDSRIFFSRFCVILTDVNLEEIIDNIKLVNLYVEFRKRIINTICSDIQYQHLENVVKLCIKPGRNGPSNYIFTNIPDTVKSLDVQHVHFNVIYYHPQLTNLKLYWYRDIYIPKSIKKLEINSCETLPELPQKLEKLSISICGGEGVYNLPDKLYSLNVQIIVDWPVFSINIPPSITHLRWYDIYNGTMPKKLPDTLKWINLYIHSADDIHNLPDSVEHIIINGHPNVTINKLPKKLRIIELDGKSVLINANTDGIIIKRKSSIFTCENI